MRIDYQCHLLRAKDICLSNRLLKKCRDGADSQFFFFIFLLLFSVLSL